MRIAYDSFQTYIIEEVLFMWNMNKVKSEKRLKLNAAIAATLLSIWTTASANQSLNSQVETFPVIPQSAPNTTSFVAKPLAPMEPLENRGITLNERMVQSQKLKEAEDLKKSKLDDVPLENKVMQKLYAERERERLTEEKREDKEKEKAQKKKQAAEPLKKKITKTSSKKVAESQKKVTVKKSTTKPNTKKTVSAKEQTKNKSSKPGVAQVSKASKNKDVKKK